MLKLIQYKSKILNKKKKNSVVQNCLRETNPHLKTCGIQKNLAASSGSKRRSNPTALINCHRAINTTYF